MPKTGFSPTAAFPYALGEQIDGGRVSAFRLANYWQHLLDTGRFGSLTEIAAAEGMDLAQVSRIARLAWLQPKQVDAILANSDNFVAEPE
ncbi:hypothetical protein ACW73L_18360 [Methylolobus aquaticus]